MDILRFHASILRIIEICLDIMRHIGKIYPAGEFKEVRGLEDRLVSRRAKSPVLKLPAKGRA
jgi:hypothetical protein